MISPKESRYDDTTLIFNKTQTDNYKTGRDRTLQNALVLHQNQSSEQLNINITEDQEMASKIHEIRVNKVIMNQK